MLGLKKGLAAAFVVALLVVGSAGSALAAYYQPSYTTPRWEALPTSFNFVGDNSPFYVTPLGFNSTAILTMIDQTTPYPHEVLFTNQNLASEFGQTKQVDRLQDLLIRTPDNGYYGFVYGNSDFFRGRILESLTLNNSLTLPAGAIIIGLGLNAYQTGDRTFDDFVFAISKTAPTAAAPTPIPGAVWLLGSGLLGLLGFRRARKGA